ncbi:MAG: hypothetical protein KAU29_02010, partial [Gammaproteobacteria bacterium]|nr:hypothetical protein [Gammaproteobacteria bacterium]
MRKNILLLMAVVSVTVISMAHAGEDVGLQRVFKDIFFQRPLAFVADPEQINVWYIVEQAGRVVRIDGRGQNTKSSIFVDITDRVESGPNETGLLGMAFDPKFSSNGR